MKAHLFLPQAFAAAVFVFLVAASPTPSPALEVPHRLSPRTPSLLKDFFVLRPWTYYIFEDEDDGQPRRSPLDREELFGFRSISINTPPIAAIPSAGARASTPQNFADAYKELHNYLGPEESGEKIIPSTIVLNFNGVHIRIYVPPAQTEDSTPLISASVAQIVQQALENEEDLPLGATFDAQVRYFLDAGHPEKSHYVGNVQVCLQAPNTASSATGSTGFTFLEPYAGPPSKDAIEMNFAYALGRQTRSNQARI